MSFQIGKVVISNQVVLAPMAGVSNTSYRKIIKAMGAGLVYAEMVSANALKYNNSKTKQLLEMSELERPINQQILGRDVETLVRAAQKIETLMHPDLIDINLGCPVSKVAVKSQAGSALLKDINQIKAIVKAVVAAVKVPVTVKIRSGWDANHLNAVEVAQACEEAGAQAIAVHARTRSQLYRGQSDWAVIKAVKQAVSIPVIGNGDVRSVADFAKMLETTGCDAVMIGRGCLGNPWLIKDCVNYSQNLPPCLVTIDDRIAMIRKHYCYLVTAQGEKKAILEMRNHLLWYFKYLPQGKKWKNKVVKIQTTLDLNQLLNEYLVDIKSRRIYY